jgi:hypothetical protein
MLANPLPVKGAVTRKARRSHDADGDVASWILLKYRFSEESPAYNVGVPLS